MVPPLGTKHKRCPNNNNRRRVTYIFIYNLLVFQDEGNNRAQDRFVACFLSLVRLNCLLSLHDYPLRAPKVFVLMLVITSRRISPAAATLGVRLLTATTRSLIGMQRSIGYMRNHASGRCRQQVSLQVQSNQTDLASG